MKDSITLQLVMQMEQFQTAVTTRLIEQLHADGHETINSGLLSFLSQLDCGVNQASQVAKNIGVSRQMVSKTVKQLCAMGYLEQTPGFQKQKQIEFTLKGEQLMSSCRKYLADMDDLILKDGNSLNEKNLVSVLEELTRPLVKN